MAKEKLTRQERAEKAFADGMLVEKCDDGWLVPSSNGKERYLVGEDFSIYRCNCRDFEFRGSYTLCWHILLVQLIRAVNAAEPVPVEPIDHEIHLKRNRVVV